MEVKRSFNPFGKRPKSKCDHAVQLRIMNDGIFELQTQKKEISKKYVDELKARLASDSKITQLKEELTKLREELCQLREENSDLIVSSITEDILNEVSHQYQMDEMVTEVQSLNNTKQQLTRELQDCKSCKEQLNRELQDAQNSKEQLGQELLDANRCTERLTQELQDSNTAKDEVEAQLRQKTERVEALEEEGEERKKRLQEVREKVKGLLVELDCEVRGRQQDALTWEKQKQRLAAKIETYENRIEDMKNELFVKGLNLRNSHETEMNKTIDKYGEIILQLKADWTAKQTALGKTLYEKDGELSVVKSRLRYAEEKMARLDLALQASYDEHTSFVDNAETLVSRKLDEIDLMIFEQKKRHKEEVASLTNGHEANLADMTKRMAQLTGNYDTELASLNERYEATRDALDDMKQRNTELERTYKTDIAALTERYQAKETGLDDMTKLMAQLTESHKAEMSSLTRKFVETKLALHNLTQQKTQETDQHNAELANLQNDYEIIEEAFTTARGLNGYTEEKLWQASSALQIEVENNEKLVADAELLIAKLRRENDEEKLGLIREHMNEKAKIISQHEKDKAQMLARFEKDRGDMLTQHEKAQDDIVAEAKMFVAGLRRENEEEKLRMLTQHENDITKIFAQHRKDIRMLSSKHEVDVTQMISHHEENTTQIGHLQESLRRSNIAVCVAQKKNEVDAEKAQRLLGERIEGMEREKEEERTKHEEQLAELEDLAERTKSELSVEKSRNKFLDEKLDRYRTAVHESNRLTQSLEKKAERKLLDKSREVEKAKKREEEVVKAWNEQEEQKDLLVKVEEAQKKRAGVLNVKEQEFLRKERFESDRLMRFEEELKNRGKQLKKDKEELCYTKKEVDSLKGTLKEKKGRLKKRECDLNKKTDELAIKSEMCEARECDLRQRSADLGYKSMCIRKQESDLKNRTVEAESRLQKRECDVDNRTAALETESENIVKEKCDLQQTRVELESREEAIVKRECDSGQKQAELESREQNIEWREYDLDNKEKCVERRDSESKHMKAELENELKGVEQKDCDLRRRSAEWRDKVDSLKRDRCDLKGRTDEFERKLKSFEKQVSDLKQERAGVRNEVDRIGQREKSVAEKEAWIKIALEEFEQDRLWIEGTRSELQRLKAGEAKVDETLLKLKAEEEYFVEREGKYQQAMVDLTRYQRNDGELARLETEVKRREMMLGQREMKLKIMMAELGVEMDENLSRLDDQTPRESVSRVRTPIVLEDEAIVVKNSDEALSSKPVQQDQGQMTSSSGQSVEQEFVDEEDINIIINCVDPVVKFNLNDKRMEENPRVMSQEQPRTVEMRVEAPQMSSHVMVDRGQPLQHPPPVVMVADGRQPAPALPYGEMMTQIQQQPHISAHQGPTPVNLAPNVMTVRHPPPPQHYYGPPHAYPRQPYHPRMGPPPFGPRHPTGPYFRHPGPNFHPRMRPPPPWLNNRRGGSRGRSGQQKKKPQNAPVEKTNAGGN